MIIKKVYKHFIVNKHKLNLLVLVKPLILFAIIVMTTLYYNKINFDMSHHINCFIYPDKKLFSDTESVTFVTNFLQKELKIVLPAKCSNYNIDNGTIYMQIEDNIMLVAPENCIVQKVDISTNFAKRIILLLTNSISCEIENVNVVGVKVGDNVKKGADIATLYANSVVSVKFYDNGELIKNIQIAKGYISWTN